MKNDNANLTVTLEVQKIYDPVLRILHIWNGLSVVLLILTMLIKGQISQYENGKEIIFRLHVFIGYALSCGILLRILWGFIGFNHARWSQLFHFKEWFKVLKTRKLNTNMSWGHDKYASIVYILFYIMMCYQIISGLMFAAQDFGMGPFHSFIPVAEKKSVFFHNLKEIHEFVYYASMVYIILHIGMIYLHEKLNKFPIAQSMFNGFQYRKSKK